MNMQRLSCSLRPKDGDTGRPRKYSYAIFFFGNGAGDDEKRIDDNAHENIVPGPAAG